MPITANEIIRLIKESLPDARVEVKDLRGNEENYAVSVMSAAFAGRTRVEQHRMVFAALRGSMGKTLRALTLATMLPCGE